MAGAETTPALNSFWELGPRRSESPGEGGGLHDPEDGVQVGKAHAAPCSAEMPHLSRAPGEADAAGPGHTLSGELPAQLDKRKNVSCPSRPGKDSPLW